MEHRYPLGFNTYCLRAFRWPDLKLLDYAASLKLDAVFLQDSLDPAAQDPAHWREVKDAAQRLGLKIETGGGASLGYWASQPEGNGSARRGWWSCSRATMRPTIG